MLTPASGPTPVPEAAPTLPRRRAIVIAFALALLAAAMLFSRVYTAFPSIRLKTVTASVPAVDGKLEIPVPDSPRLAQMTRPAVLIVTLKGGAMEPSPVRITWNGASVKTVDVDANETSRFDLTLPVDVQPHGGDVIRFHSLSGTWALDYLEIATLHGSTRGIVDAVFVPRETAFASHPSWLAIVVIPIAMVWLRLHPSPIRRRWLRLSLIALQVIVALGFLLAIASPFVAPVKVGLAFGSFLGGVAILCAEGLRLAARRANAWIESTGRPGLVYTLLTASVVTIGFGTMVSHMLADYQGNYSGFMHIAQRAVDRSPFLAERPDLQRTLAGESSTGYDGQFMYLMAFDPLLLRFANNPVRYREVVDAPPYRYGRIGFSLLIKLFALNHPEAFPQTMVWLILASHFLAVVCLGTIAVHYGQHPAWGLTYLAVPGYWPSLWAALPEPVAGLGLVAGVLLLIKSRYALAALAFAMSLLIRETGAILIICLAAWLAIGRRQPRNAAIVASALVPLGLWRLYVGWRLFSDYGREAFFFNAQNLGPPFRGLIDLWAEVARGTYQSGTAYSGRGAQAYVLLIIAMLIVGLVALWKRRDALSAAIVAYAFLAASLTYTSIWVHWGNGERGTYEMFLLAIVSFLTLDSALNGLRRVYLAAFALTAIYTWYYSSFGPELHALF